MKNLIFEIQCLIFRLIRNSKYLNAYFFDRKYRKSDSPWNINPYNNYYSYVFRILKSLKKKFGNILDIGCGNGVFTARLSAFSNNITGIDISPTAIKYARKAYPKINFQVCDIRNFYAKSKFDLIVCLEVIYYFNRKDVKIVLNKIYNFLKNDGMFVLGLWSPNKSYYYNKNEIKNFLKDENFQFLYSRKITKEHLIFLCKK